MKSVEIRRFFWSIFSRIQSECRERRTKKTLFLDTFHAVYILLTRYSNNRNLNLCLHNKYLHRGLVLKIFKIIKIVFLPCFYVRDNRIFPTGGSPPHQPRICSSPPPVRLPPHQIFISPSPHQQFSSNNSIKTLFLAVVIAPVPFLFYLHTFCTQRSS